ncbi:DUF4253 domain-containing protein [Erythrobacter sp. HA6-11]
MGFLAKLAAIFGLSPSAASAQVTSQAVDQTTERMRTAFPYEIVSVAGEKALVEWERLKTKGKGWPVIVGGDEDLSRVLEQFSIDDPSVFPAPADAPWQMPPSRSIKEILQEADKIDPSAKLLELFDYEYGDDPPELEQGEWPEPGTTPPMALTVASDILTGRPFAKAHIVVLPTQDPAEITAFLRWGGWNACPRPEVHVALHRKWHEQYGAEIVGISGDVINMRVQTRPVNQDEAISLAREQFLYCSDIVMQGTQTLEPLAMSLLESDWWYFWWD